MLHVADAADVALGADVERLEVRAADVRACARCAGVSVSTMSVSLLGCASCCARIDLQDREVGQDWHAAARALLRGLEEPREQVGLAVLEPDLGVDPAVAEGRRDRAGGAVGVVADAGQLDLELERHLAVVVHPRA